MRSKIAMLLISLACLLGVDSATGVRAQSQTQPMAPASPAKPFVCDLERMLADGSLAFRTELEIDESKIDKQELSAKSTCALIKYTWASLGTAVALPDGRKVAFESAHQMAAIFPAPKTDWQNLWHDLLRDVRHIAVWAGHGIRCGYVKEVEQLRNAWFQKSIVRRSLHDEPSAFVFRYFDVLQSITAGTIEAKADDGTKTRVGNTAPCTDAEKAKVRALIESSLKP